MRGEGAARRADKRADYREVPAILGPPLTPDQFSRLIEVRGGVPILRKAPPRLDLTRLQVGQVVRDPNGSAWRVEKVSPASAELRCLLGRKAGDVETRSPSSSGYTFTTEAEIDAEKRTAAVTRAAHADETRCPNCWPDEGGEEAYVPHPGPEYDTWAARGRDPGCPDHQVTEQAVERATRGAVVRDKREEDPADVAKVLELRATGMAYHLIEKEMGWPDTRGGRPWRIVKAAGLIPARQKPSPEEFTPPTKKVVVPEEKKAPRLVRRKRA